MWTSTREIRYVIRISLSISLYLFFSIFSILVVSWFMWSGSLESPNFLLSYSITSPTYCTSKHHTHNNLIFLPLHSLSHRCRCSTAFAIWSTRCLIYKRSWTGRFLVLVQVRTYTCDSSIRAIAIYKYIRILWYAILCHRYTISYDNFLWYMLCCVFYVIWI